MKTNRLMFRRRTHGGPEAGQALLFYILVLGTFLLAVLLFAFDLSNMWFHRQAAQSAADAACAAGAMDLLVDAQGGATGHQGFTLGTGYSCTTSSTDSVCSYAAKNGYTSNNVTPGGNLVSVSFPTSVTGVTAPPAGVASTAYIRVDILDHVQTFFAGLLNGATNQDVRAFSTCGLELAAAPIPLLVLDPKNPSSKTSALSVQGTPSITIWGGPQQSIQVNSAGTSSTPAVNIGGSASIDLHLGGPNNTGSNLGTWGGPPAGTYTGSSFNSGTTGQWIAPSSPISDPFAQIPAPTNPGGTQPAIISVTGPITSPVVCQDTACAEYQPGIYPNGICIGKSCKGAGSSCIGPSNTCNAIFDPGVYYLQGDFTVDSNSCLRPSGAVGDGSGGTMFFFQGAVNVDANAGSKCTSPFLTAGYSSTASLKYGVKCTATSSIPGNLSTVTSLTGNVMLAPCTGPGGAAGPYGDPYEYKGLTDPQGEQRGFLFFQDRSVENASQSWGGGGSFLLAGTMYFHSCNSSGTGTGCGAAGTYYTDNFSLGGNSGSSTYVLGDIVADNVTLQGNSGITMDLNTTTAFNILKASIFQ